MATRNAVPKLNLLPASAGPFLRRRASELAGFLSFTLAACWALMLATHQPSDPSWNAATGAPTMNWLSAFGAHFADVMLQTLGLAAALPVLVLAAWGWRLLSHRGLAWFWLRLAMLPLALVAGAGFAANFAAPVGWPFAAGFGGIAGDLVLIWIRDLAGIIGLALWPPALAAGFSLIALITLITALGMDLGEWRGLGRGPDLGRPQRRPGRRRRLAPGQHALDATSTRFSRPTTTPAPDPHGQRRGRERGRN